VRTEHHFAQRPASPWQPSSAGNTRPTGLSISFNPDSNPLASSENKKRTTMSTRVATDTFTSGLAMAGEKNFLLSPTDGPSYNRNDHSYAHLNRVHNQSEGCFVAFGKRSAITLIYAPDQMESNRLRAPQRFSSVP
jgi:hypothetical protein